MINKEAQTRKITRTLHKKSKKQNWEKNNFKWRNNTRHCRMQPAFRVS